MLTALFPIGDDNSDRASVPWVTYLLIAANFAVFLFWQLPSPHQAFTYGYSVIPKEILTGHDFLSPIYVASQNLYLPEAPGPSPIYLTILWAMFMHAGWAHILGNMLYLWIFGDNVEEAMGPFRFLGFYLLCGFIACCAQLLAAVAAGGLDLYIPSLGASGAIAGVLGAYLILYPTRRVKVLIGWFGIIMVPAFLVIGLWILMQVYSGVGSIALTDQSHRSGGVAYWAHIGGAVAGMILVWRFRKPQPLRTRVIRH